MFKEYNANLLLAKRYVAEISQFLRINKETLCIAESCTGGLISHLFTNSAGSSHVFLGSVISYTRSVKVDLLKIPSELLEEKGDVTPKVAELMARGVKSLLKADWSLSITGLMVPTDDKVEIGRIYTAVMSPYSEVEVFSIKVAGSSRSEMKDQSSIFCLENLRNKIKKQNKTKEEVL